MAIKTARAEGTASVTIDCELCTNCGLCVRVCKGAPLYLENGVVRIDQSRFFGCIGCGHCAAVCPADAIAVTGRDLAPADLVPLPGMQARASYEQLYSLLLSRRSIREFQDRDVEADVIQQIIEAASTAPMGLPPSDVEILVLNGREKVQQFAGDIVQTMRGYSRLLGLLTLRPLRPFIGKEATEAIVTFLLPVLKFIPEYRARGTDWLLYDAPLAMYFHTSPYSDPVDPMVVATYAMIAAEALGLGSCMIGTPAFLLKGNKKLKARYGIGQRNQQGVMLILGYPAIRYTRAVKRRLGRVTYYTDG